MSVPPKAASYHTTEHLLELALTMLESARREQNNDQLPANNWLTNSFPKSLTYESLNPTNGHMDRSALTPPSAARDD